MACTGIEFCKLAIVETKARGASTWSTSWSAGSPTSTCRITVNINGCPNACARIQVADIGLKGQLVTGRATATRSRASRCTSAAALGLEAGFGRKLRGHKVTARRAGRLRQRRASRASWPSATEGERFAPGSPAPTRRSCRDRGERHEPEPP